MIIIHTYCNSTSKRKILQYKTVVSSGSSGWVRGGRETWNLCGRLRQPSFLWPIFTGPGGPWPPRHPPPDLLLVVHGSSARPKRSQVNYRIFSAERNFRYSIRSTITKHFNLTITGNLHLSRYSSFKYTNYLTKLYHVCCLLQAMEIEKISSINCQVCGYPASSFHYGTNACDACKVSRNKRTRFYIYSSAFW